jgi:transposase
VVREEFAEDPFTGDVFVFFNKARDRIKLLFWDRNGFWLLYKRLERGTFPFDVRGDGARLEITRAQLSMILEGIDGKSVRMSSHFSATVAIRSRGGGDGSRARATP